MSDSNFEIRRQALGTPNQSGVLLQPSGVTSLPRGIAVAFDGSLNLIEAEPGSGDFVRHPAPPVLRPDNRTAHTLRSFVDAMTNLLPGP